MRGHGRGWRRMGGNSRVRPRREKPALRQRWHVVGMDKVMRQTRMRRLLPKQFLENRSCLEASGVGLVGGIFGSRDRQGVEDLRLMVFWIFRRELAHAVAVGEQ